MVLKRTWRCRTHNCVWEWCKNVWYSNPEQNDWNDELFENDVKMYGTQTIEQAMSVCLVFENDVKMYGTQTSMMHSCTELGFENDVKMYGTQTNTVTIGQTRRLRMM